MNRPPPTRDAAPLANAWAADLAIDTSGLRCPLPVLKARKALRGLEAGQRLLVTATDPMAAIDLPHFCAGSGHRLVASEARDGLHRFLIERGPD